MKYLITLKSGVIMEVTNYSSKNMVGLWVWALRQMVPQVITFEECSVLASEIAVISKVDEIGQEEKEEEF